MGCIVGRNWVRALAGLLLLEGCTHAGDSSSVMVATRTLPPSAPLSPPPTASSTDSSVPGSPTGFELVPGTGALFGASAQPMAASAQRLPGGITLNLVNVDVRDAAKAVLGDYLKKTYTIGANVQGNVTIQTGTPVAPTELLPLFEQALRSNGLALVSNAGTYRVVTVAEAAKDAASAGISTAATPQAGFGVQIVPLKYATASEMVRLLTPLAPAQAIVEIDTVRNALILQGSERERAALIDAINIFDVNWLVGMSFALITPHFTDAQALARDLTQVLGSPDNPAPGLVRLVPIERLNAVLAISPQLAYLQQLQQWAERLDQPGQGTNRRIFIYSVQNGRASDLASVLLKALSTGATRNPVAMDAGIQDLPAGGPAAGPNSNPLIQPFVAATPAAPPGVADAAAPRSNITITADERSNAIVIMASPQEYGSIESALRDLDSAPLQVLLEAAIAEVTLTDNLQYGVQYFYQPGSKQEAVLSTGLTDTIAATLPGFAYTFTRGSNIKVILDALSSVTHVEVVSSPEILVLNNHSATLQVGDQVPIVTQQAISTLTAGAPLVNNVQYHDTGVILKVTPRVNRGGMVMMDISQEVSSVAQTTTSSIDSPTINERKIESTVAVHDSETVALGGLIMDNTTVAKNGIPVLQSIPVLGNLFTDTQKSKTRTELMVLITPHVLDSIEKARSVTDELKRKLPAIQYLVEHSH